MVRVEVLLKNLNDIKEVLADDQHEMFLCNFKQWESQRQKSIFALSKLHKELLDVKVTVQVGQTISNGIGILGTIGAFVGLGISIFGDEEDKETGNTLMAGGGVAAIAGLAGAAILPGLERINNVIIMEKMKETLELDLKMTKELLPFLERAEILDNLCNKTFHCSVTSANFQCLMVTIAKIEEIYKKGKKTYRDICNFLSTDKPCSNSSHLEDEDSIAIKKLFSHLDLNIKEFLKEFCTNPEVRCRALKIYNYVKNPVFQFLKNATPYLRRLKADFPKGFKTSVTLINLYDFAVSVRNILLRVIESALQLLNEIKAANEIDNETEKYSEKLKEVINSLEWEMNSLQEVFTKCRERSN